MPTACPTAADSPTLSHAPLSTGLPLPHSPPCPAPSTPTPVSATARPPGHLFPFWNSMATPTRRSSTTAAPETRALCLRSRTGLGGGQGVMAVRTQRLGRRLRRKRGTVMSRIRAMGFGMSCATIISLTWVTIGRIPALLFHRSMHRPLSWTSSMLITDPRPLTYAWKRSDRFLDGVFTTNAIDESRSFQFVRYPFRNF